VRKYENSKEGYEEILEMKPRTIVLEPTGVYAIRPSLQGEGDKNTTS
jgi:transposase